MLISFLFAAPSLSLICVLEKDEASTGFVCLFVSLRGGINCTHLLINTVSLHEAVRLEEFQWRVEGLERCSAGCDKNCGFRLSGGHRNVIHTPTQSAGDWTVGAGEKRMWGFFLKKRHQDVMKREWEQKKKKSLPWGKQVMRLWRGGGRNAASLKNRWKRRRDCGEQWGGEEASRVLIKEIIWLAVGKTQREKRVRVYGCQGQQPNGIIQSCAHTLHPTALPLWICFWSSCTFKTTSHPPHSISCYLSLLSFCLLTCVYIQHVCSLMHFILPLHYLLWSKLVLCDTADFSMDFIPSEYRASIANTIPVQMLLT